MFALGLLTAIFILPCLSQKVPIKTVRNTDTREDCQRNEFHNGVYCEKCPQFTVSERGAIQCKPCPPGQFLYVDPKYFFLAQEESICKVCPPGFYTGGKDRSCYECPTGTFSTHNNSEICTPCPKGQTTRWKRSTNSTMCYSCRGYIRDKGHLTKCLPCPTGSYSKSADGKCTACPPGTSTGNGVERSSRGASSIAECTGCDPGTSTAGSSGFPNCRMCRKGFYTAKSSTVRCLRCPKGSVPSPDRRRCVPDCDLKETACQKKGCPPGTAPFKGDVSDCRPCPSGRINNNYSVTECSECAHGMGMPNAAKDNCHCSGMRITVFNELTAREECNPCPYKKVKLNETQCGCPPGQSSSSIFSSCFCQKLLHQPVGQKCVKCSDEEVKRSISIWDGPSDAWPCRLCGSHTVFNQKTEECEPCHPGTAKRGHNLLTKCDVKCRPGTAGSGCRACRRGYYSDKSGLPACKQCPEGRRYSLSFGATSCPLACPKNAVAVRGKCECEIETIEIKTEDGFACVLCSKGSHSDYRYPVGGCECDEDRITTKAGRFPECARCQEGLKPDRLQLKCICPDGYGMENGKCVKCPAGSASITQVAAGKFIDGVCGPCSSNRISGAGSGTCTSCAPGTFTKGTGATKCIGCPKGQFLTKDFKCTACEPGFQVRNRECVKCVGAVSEGGVVGYCTPCEDEKVPSDDGRTCVSHKST